MKDMLISEIAPVQKQKGRVKRKGKAKVNDEGKGSNDLPPPKTKFGK
jgi:hypothetical protein